jgi:hypothetical protein
MPLPPLYKLLDVEGAKKTLGNRCFRHAKPSSFNDTEDLTVSSIFRESADEAVAIMGTSLVDIIMQNLSTPITATNAGLRANVAGFQTLLRQKPELAPEMKRLVARSVAELNKVAPVMETLATETIDGINAHMQRHRVLCVTTLLDSERMWSGYAQHHKGVALRIEGNPAKASKFECFERVSYFKTRPVLYESVAGYVESALFGDREVRNREAMHKITYSKTLEWSHESEYRLVIFLPEGEEWDTCPYHPEEITELYLGFAMDKSDKVDIVDKARTVNPSIKIFQLRWKGAGGLAWDAIK